MNSRHYLRALLGALTLALTLSGCSTLGRASMNSAEDAWKAGNPSSALMYASQAILEDPKYSAPKVFLRENAEQALSQIQSYLDSSLKSTAPEDLERRFDTFNDLVKFYGNLKKVGLPIAEGKKLFGLIKSWEWTTEMKDYTPQIEVSRMAARDGFYAAATASLGKGDLDKAYEYGNKMVTKFALKDSEEQKGDKAKLSTDFASWAKKFHGSTDPEALLKAIKAYELALRFNSADASATEGLAKMKTELSEVYLALGLKSERANTVDSLKEAIEFFNKALKYNAQNTKATEGIPRAKHQISVLYCDAGERQARTGKIDDMIAAHKSYVEALKWDGSFQRALDLKSGIENRIAEAYYAEGIRQSANKKSQAAIDAAIAAFDSAMKWVPNYKDAEVQKRRMYVSKELVILGEKLGKTMGEFAQTQQRVTFLSSKVDKAHQGMEDLNSVADSVVQLDEQLLVLSKTASALSGIPVIGSVISVTGTALSRVHTPVKATSSKIKSIRAPVITPAREALQKTKDQTDRIVSSMESIATNLQYVQKVTARLNDCMAKTEDPAVVSSVDKDVKELNKIMDDLNKGLATVNSVQDKIEGTLVALANSVSTITPVRKGIDTVMKPLNKIKGVTDEIYDVLKKKISVPLVGSFTVEQAINSTTGVVKKAAEAILNPILKKLGIDIPTIPGIDKFDQLLDQVQGYYNDAKMAAQEIGNVANQIVDIPNRLKAMADDIVTKSGCPL